MKPVHALALMTALAVPPAFGADTATDTGAAGADAALQAAVNGDWRSADEKSRDRYRHPVESLTFWGLKPGMTVLEVQPGGGWWTNILAPYARATGGKLYVTAADLQNPKLSDAAKKARADFEARYAARPETFGKLDYVDWGAVSRSLPANTFDLILTARSVHGWMQQGPDVAQQTFAEFHEALKPGGILAVEQHRAHPKNGAAEDPKSGYVSEQHVIDLAQKAGFKLAAKSEINANPKDTKDHPFGVWTLPPALYSTPYGSGQPDDPKFDHSKYLAIGESDRMTLKFVK
ncbi:MAG TPA: methyltransferase domain-containing protein [Steroidobacteraceae bacterium]|nr:methyltransferase domain-containing protein [Steroidobacteraceae bacterium]